QTRYSLSASRHKMEQAIAALPDNHPGRARFRNEIANIDQAAQTGAAALLARFPGRQLSRVPHTALEFSEARAGDLALLFSDGSRQPISVKTDKTGRLAVAEGQTHDLGAKWAARYFQVDDTALDTMRAELGVASDAELKAHYLNVAQLAARVIMRALDLHDCQPHDFSRARVGNLAAVKYLFRQLLRYKHGNDDSVVIALDRATGRVKWESRLDAVDIDQLDAARISFTPARPRRGNPVSSTFGIRIDGRTVVTFQIKHKRGKAGQTALRQEFSDITTRLAID
ncbi:MAG: hypothetical protein ACKV2V_26070, partial [Blastocatellia bacterium]